MVPHGIQTNIVIQIVLKLHEYTTENKKNSMDIRTNKLHSRLRLLNILKAYYVNTHQDKPKLTDTEGTGRLQLAVDTRQTLDKRPPHHRSLPGPHNCLFILCDTCLLYKR